MKIVNSYDLFDTILGRKVNNQNEIFKRCMLLNKLENFVIVRFEAEQKAKEENIYYNLTTIYKFIQSHYKLNYSKIIQYINIEILVEYDNVYPIYNNINKLNADCIIISETYYTSEQLKKFLSKFNIIDIPIYTSNEFNISKTDSSIYIYLKKMYKIKTHTGSNYIEDYQIPNTCKINSVHYEYIYNPVINKLQNKLTSLSKDYFKMIECFCSKQENESVWNAQLYYNIPILLLFANIINDFCNEKQIQEIIFINRNCVLLKQIFELVNKNTKVNVKITELPLSFTLLQNKKYIKYLISKFNSTTKYLIIDLHDGFKHVLTNLFKITFKLDPYFYFIFNNSNNKGKFVYSLYNNDEDLSRLIELLNLSNIGLPIDCVNNIIKYEDYEFDNNIPNCFSELVNLILQSITTNILQDLNQNFLTEFIANLNDLKKKVLNNSEYKILRDIYILSDKFYLKPDYYNKYIPKKEEERENEIVQSLNQNVTNKLKKEYAKLKKVEDIQNVLEIPGILNPSLRNVLKKELVKQERVDPVKTIEVQASLNPSLRNVLKKEIIKQYREDVEKIVEVQASLNPSLRNRLKRENSQKVVEKEPPKLEYQPPKLNHPPILNPILFENTPKVVDTLERSEKSARSERSDKSENVGEPEIHEKIEKQILRILRRPNPSLFENKILHKKQLFEEPQKQDYGPPPTLNPNLKNILRKQSNKFEKAEELFNELPDIISIINPNLKHILRKPMPLPINKKDNEESEVTEKKQSMIGTFNQNLKNILRREIIKQDKVDEISNEIPELIGMINPSLRNILGKSKSYGSIKSNNSPKTDVSGKSNNNSDKEQEQ